MASGGGRRDRESGATRVARSAGERRRDRAQLRAPALASCATAPRCARWSRPTATATARSQSARAALAGGASWLAVAERAARRASCARPACGDARVLVMGALSRGRAARGARGRRGRGRVARATTSRRSPRPAAGACTSSSTPAWAGSARATRSEATRVLAAARDDARGASWRALMTHFATADELDDDGFFERQLDAFARWARAAEGRAAGAARARRQQRRHAARRATRSSTWCAAGSPIYGMDPFGEDPAARGARAGARAELLRRRGEAVPGGGERRLRAALRRRARHQLGVLPIGYGDGWRRGAVQQRRRADRRAPLPAGGDGEHGQHHRRPRRRRERRAAARRAGDPDRRPGRASGSPPRRWRGAWTRSTTRSRAR